MELDFGLLTTSFVAALGVLYILYITASVTREEMSIHDLRVNTHTLRNAYAKKLSNLRGENEELVSVDIVDDESETAVASEVAEAAKAA